MRWLQHHLKQSFNYKLLTINYKLKIWNISIAGYTSERISSSSLPGSR